MRESESQSQSVWHFSVFFFSFPIGFFLSPLSPVFIGLFLSLSVPFLTHEFVRSLLVCWCCMYLWPRDTERNGDSILIWSWFSLKGIVARNAYTEKRSDDDDKETTTKRTRERMEWEKKLEIPPIHLHWAGNWYEKRRCRRRRCRYCCCCCVD